MSLAASLLDDDACSAAVQASLLDCEPEPEMATRDEQLAMESDARLSSGLEAFADVVEAFAVVETREGMLFRVPAGQAGSDVPEPEASGAMSRTNS